MRSTKRALARAPLGSTICRRRSRGRDVVERPFKTRPLSGVCSSARGSRRRMQARTIRFPNREVPKVSRLHLACAAWVVAQRAALRGLSMAALRFLGFRRQRGARPRSKPASSRRARFVRSVPRGGGLRIRAGSEPEVCAVPGSPSVSGHVEVRRPRIDDSAPCS